MPIDFNSVSGTVSNYYNSATQNAPSTQAVSQTLQSMPSDTIALASKSLLTGINTSNQILKARRSEVPTETTKYHAGADILKSGRNGAIFSGLVSTTKNTIDFLQGNISGTQAGGNITADVVGGIGGGLAAAGTASLATTMLGSSLSAGIVGFSVAAAAFVGVDMLYRNTGIYDAVAGKAKEFLDAIFTKVNPPGGW